MKGLKKKRRIQIVLVAAVALFGSTALVGYALRGGINLYRSPSQLETDPPHASEVFRLGGLVEAGTLRRGEGTTVTFDITDGGSSVPVTYKGVLPDLFGEGQGTIATGRYIDGRFVATEILAKHDENYMPKEVVQTLKEQGLYQPPAKEGS